MGIMSSIAGAGLSQFLHGIAKLKKGQAWEKAQLPSALGLTPASPSSSSALMSQIQSSVTQALQAAKANGSTQDPNQIVEDAVSSLLKNVWSGKTAATSPVPVSQQAFQSALQAAGISPEQFHRDLRNAMEDAQSSLATSGSPGGLLDTAA